MDQQPPAADAAAQVAGKKRKRVAFNEGANTTAEEPAARAAPALRANLPTHTATGKPRVEDRRRLEMDDDEDEEGDVVVPSNAVKAKRNVDSDDDDDDGNEEEEAPGAASFERKLGKKKGDVGEDEDEDERDDSAAAKGVSGALQHVKGERGGRLVEEFNDAGDAFEPFHLKREREEGYFDEGGNYHWKQKKGKKGKKGKGGLDGSDDEEQDGRRKRDEKDDDDDEEEEEEDAWLDELDEMDPRERAKIQQQAAAKAKTKVKRGAGAGAGGAGGAGAARKRNNSDEDEDEGNDDDDNSDNDDDATAGGTLLPPKKIELLLTIRSLLSDDGKETVADALRRLSGRHPQHGKEAKNMPSFDRLTEAADTLMRAGGASCSDVYSWRRKDATWQLDDACDDAGGAEAGFDPVAVIRAFENKAGSTNSSASAGASASASSVAAAAAAPAAAPLPDANNKRWEYRWTEGEDGEVFGPFTTAELLAWKTAGCFGPHRPLFLRELLPGPAPAPAADTAADVAAPAATTMKVEGGGNGENDDDDDDIFSGAGGYDLKKAAATSSNSNKGPWLRHDQAGF